MHDTLLSALRRLCACVAVQFVQIAAQHLLAVTQDDRLLHLRPKLGLARVAQPKTQPTVLTQLHHTERHRLYLSLGGSQTTSTALR